MKKVLCVFLFLVMLSAILPSCSNNSNTAEKTSKDSNIEEAETTKKAETTSVVNADFKNTFEKIDTYLNQNIDLSKHKKDNQSVTDSSCTGGYSWDYDKSEKTNCDLNFDITIDEDFDVSLMSPYKTFLDKGFKSSVDEKTLEPGKYYPTHTFNNQNKECYLDIGNFESHNIITSEGLINIIRLENNDSFVKFSFRGISNDTTLPEIIKQLGVPNSSIIICSSTVTGCDYTLKYCDYNQDEKSKYLDINMEYIVENNTARIKEITYSQL